MVVPPMGAAPDGRVMTRSDSLLALRDYVAKHPLDILRIECGVDVSSGILKVFFKSGAYYETSFHDYLLMLRWLERWRDVRDVPHKYYRAVDMTPRPKKKR